jgi:hypothetical protein
VKPLNFILIGFLGMVVGFIAGIVIAYAFPEGFPGAEGPPADQKQSVLTVGIGSLDPSQGWLRDFNVFLSPLIVVRGDRCYSVLVFAPRESSRINTGSATELYLEAKGMDIVQPIEIDQNDCVDLAAHRIVVKLLDEGPHSDQYYSNAKDLNLKSQP